MRHTGHKVGDLVICDFPTDYGQAMARSDKGLIIEIRESDYGSVELKVRWEGTYSQNNEIIWMRCPGNLKIISKGAQQ
jgi:hypothetical protein